MTDERMAELRSDRDKAIERRTELKRKMEDMHAAIQKGAAEVQRLNAARKDLAEPYKVATEQVADLTSQIEAEERRRAEEAAAARAAEKAAAESSAAAEQTSGD